MKILTDQRGYTMIDYLLTCTIIFTIAFAMYAVIKPSISNVDTRMTDHIQSLNRTGM